MTRSASRFTLSWALLFALAGCDLDDPWRTERNRYRENARVGISESEVRTRLGVPQFEYTAGNAPEEYYVDGYSHEEREIAKKVLIYVGTEPICYVWIDDSNRVEHVFVGGS